jgi:hypothetical protein
MAGFLFRLEATEGAPADPSKLEEAVPNWGPDDVISLGRERPQLRVVRVQDDDADQPPVLVVKRSPRLVQTGHGGSSAALSGMGGERRAIARGGPGVRGHGLCHLRIPG